MLQSHVLWLGTSLLIVWWLIKWNIAWTKCIAKNPSWRKSNDFDITISCDLNSIMMIESSSADRICNARGIKWSFLPLDVSSYWIYIIAPSLGQYTGCCICVEIDAIYNSVEVAIHQVGRKASVYLLARVFIRIWYLILMENPLIHNTKLSALIRRMQRTNSQYPWEHVNVRNGLIGFRPTTESWKEHYF